MNEYLKAATWHIERGEHNAAVDMMREACIAAARVRHPNFGKCIVALNRVIALANAECA